MRKYGVLILVILEVTLLVLSLLFIEVKAADVLILVILEVTLLD